MAKLYFTYGPMGSGKSREIIEFVNANTDSTSLIFSSCLDTRFSSNKIASRNGSSIPCLTFNNETNFINIINEKSIKVIIIDESQFLTINQVNDLIKIVDDYDIDIRCYGLKSDFKLQLFESSNQLLILADEIEELKTLCTCCEKKAILNIRYSIKESTIGRYKRIMTEGAQVQIGGNDSYMPLCRKCYKKLLDLTNKIEAKDNQ